MKTLTLLCVGMLASLLTALAGPAPMLIPFQGRLTDQQGRPYTNGQYSITFTIYDQAVGGANLWSERHEKVGVINGTVNVFLGSVTAFTNLSFSETRHLGITIDADNNPFTAEPEMIPRQMIIPAFWSKQADNSTKLAGRDWTSILLSNSNDPESGFLNGAKLGGKSITQAQIADSAIGNLQLGADAVTASKIQDGQVGTAEIANGSVTPQKLSASVANAIIPAGTIVAFGGNGSTPPVGWLFCNGDAQPTAAYPDLFSAIGTAWGTAGPGNFRVPDLRGVFLRGKNTGRTGRFADPEAGLRINEFGGLAGDSVGSFQDDQLKSHTHDAARVNGGPNYKSAGGDPRVNEGQTSAVGGTETRPKNAYVNYIIKY